MKKPLAAPMLATAIASYVATAPAQDISTEPGWSGTVNIGAGAGQSETNMLAAVSSIDLGDDRLDRLGEDAGSEDIAFPALQFDIRYTLANSRTQFYLRNQPSPYVFVDLEALGGIRQQVPGVGIVDLALSSTTIATDVWKDPYLAGANRGDTERTTTGLHIGWQNIMDSALSFQFSSKEVEIDDEDSGESVDLGLEERRLLERTGEVYRFHFAYAWQLADNHRLTPAFSWLDYDLDGGAMAEDGFAVQIDYSYQRERWRFLARAQYTGLDADEDNPIFAEAADRDILGLSVAAFYESPFGLENWTANARASWYDSDNDIDFYDESLATVSVGMLYRFD